MKKKLKVEIKYSTRTAIPQKNRLIFQLNRSKEQNFFLILIRNALIVFPNKKQQKPIRISL